MSTARQDVDPHICVLIRGVEWALMVLILLWLWTDFILPGRSDSSCAAFHVNNALFLPPLCRLPADGRRADVRCCTRGGRGCAAVSADHCQLITVQPTQALALREPLHGPHQRGRCFCTCSLLCPPPQHTQHLHTENTCSQEQRTATECKWDSGSQEEGSYA